MYQKLLSVLEQRIQIEDILQKKRNEFEEKNSVLIAQLEDLKEKETILREEALLSLEKEGVNSVEVGDKVVYRQMRVTKLIDNAGKLRDDIFSHRDELEEIGIKPEGEPLFAEEVVVVDKKKVMEIAEAYSKVNGKEFDGITIKETKFVAVKDK